MGDKSNKQVLSTLSNIKKTRETKPEKEENSEDNLKKIDEDRPIDVRGKPKSGKFWKSSRERFSTVNKTKGLRQDFQKKTALRLELKRTKDLAKQAMEDIKQKQIERKERRRENLKRTEENKRKAEVVQVITNTAKIKRMRKKQLRFIQKRDVNKEAESSK